MKTLSETAAAIDSLFSSETVSALVRSTVQGMSQADTLTWLENLVALMGPKYYENKNWRIDAVNSVYYALGGVKLGMGATLHIGSDSAAYTVVAVSKSGKQVTLQADTATIDPKFKPVHIPGGFAGHVTNNGDQTYTYARNDGAPTIKARLHKDGRFYAGSLRVGFGYRRAFHDYNF